MSIEKILEMFSLEKLDESKQNQIKETLQTIVETKAQEIAKEKVEEALVGEKEKLVETYEKKFEDYKEDITSKFSNFVDSILEEEMLIPEKVLKYARIGELYEDLIDQFKVRLALDEGLLEKEVKGILKEAKEEIQNLRDQLNESVGKNLELQEDAKQMATHIYLRKKVDGLTESQKTAVMSILEGASKEEIDKKFEVVLESVTVKTEEKTEQITESNSVVEVKEEKNLNEETVKVKNPLMEEWVKTLKTNRF